MYQPTIQPDLNLFLRKSSPKLKGGDSIVIDELPRPGTSHVVAADASGMAISVTSTVNLLFGFVEVCLG